MAICIERQLHIYRSQTGPARAILFNLIRTAGMVVRVGYFSVRSAWPGRRLEYDRAMRRFYLVSLRVHARLMAGVK